MNTISLISQPPSPVPLFSPVDYSFRFDARPNLATASTLGGTTLGGYLCFVVSSSVYNDISEDSFIVVDSGAYAGIWKVKELLGLYSGSNYYFSVWRQYDTVTSPGNIRICNVRTFEIWGGYTLSPGNVSKPLEKIADIKARPDAQGFLNIDVSGYLQAYNEIKGPEAGADFNISLEFELRESGSQYGYKYGYFSAVSDLTPYLQAGKVLCKNGVIQFRENGSNLPVITSAINQSSKALQNFPGCNGNEITTTSGTFETWALAGSCFVVKYIPSVPPPSFVPVSLPAFVSVLASPPGELWLQICPGGEVSDYASSDYNPGDYLTGSGAISGAYTFEFTNGSGGAAFTCTINFYDILGQLEICTKRAINLAWLNPEGGFSSFIFTGVKEYGVEIEGDSRFKDASGVWRVSKVSDVRKTVKVSASLVPKWAREFLAPLRYSLAVWIYNPVSCAWDIPAIIERESFSISTDKNRPDEGEISFVLTYSEPVKIQNL